MLHPHVSISSNICEIWLYNRLLVVITHELSYGQLTARGLVVVKQSYSFFRPIEEKETPTASAPVMNENAVDDEVEVISDDLQELYSVELTAGNAGASPVVGTLDHVQERRVDIHLLEYIESKTNKNTNKKMDQCVRRVR